MPSDNKRVKSLNQAVCSSPLNTIHVAFKPQTRHTQISNCTFPLA